MNCNDQKGSSSEQEDMTISEILSTLVKSRARLSKVTIFRISWVGQISFESYYFILIPIAHNLRSLIFVQFILSEIFQIYFDIFKIGKTNLISDLNHCSNCQFI